MDSIAHTVEWLIKTAGILSLTVIAFFVTGVISLFIWDGDDEDDEDWEDEN